MDLCTIIPGGLVYYIILYLVFRTGILREELLGKADELKLA